MIITLPNFFRTAILYKIHIAHPIIADMSLSINIITEIQIIVPAKLNHLL